MEQNFFVGAKVKIITGEVTVSEKDGGLGVEGEIIETDTVGNKKYFLVKSNQFTSSCRSWWYDATQMELISKSVCPKKGNCPRCSNVMILKEGMGFFGEKFDVLKCEKCGYC
jgi:hypothetical protein